MKWWGAVIAVAVAALWLTGTFDKALEPWGLNVNECSENAFGAVVCGKELERLRGPTQNYGEWLDERKARREAREDRQERQWERAFSEQIARASGAERREDERVAREMFPHWDEREKERRASR